MKHFILSFILFLPLTLLATDCIPDCEYATDWTLQVRGAYYNPLSKPFRKVYTEHLLDYQVEGSKRIHPFCEIWASVDWASKQGHAQRIRGPYDYPFKNKTKVFILPINIGLKFVYSIMPYVDVYAGAGISYSFLRIKNRCKEDYSYWGLVRSPFKKEIYKNGWGSVFKIGLQYAMSESTFLDFFCDYYWQRFSFPQGHHARQRWIFKDHLDCSGYKLGIGLGVYF